MALYLGDKLIATAPEMKDRFLFKGELTLESTRTDWEDLIPCKTAQVYYLVNTTNPEAKATIGTETFSVGDWVFVKNNVKTGETGVEVQKMSSASDAIKIVDELPTTGINEKIFYAVPHTQGYSYNAVKWYVIKAGTTNVINSDGIYNDTGVVLLKTADITAQADVLVYCDTATAADAEASASYILNYTKVYDDGTTAVVWCTHAQAPYEPTASEWSESVPAKTYSVYVYNTQDAEWNCIYPSQAQAVRWGTEIASFDAPKNTVLYGLYGQTQVKYFKMSDDEKTAGSTIDATGVTLVNAGVTLTYAEIAANIQALTMTYGFTEVTQDNADNDCVVTYNKNDKDCSEWFGNFELSDKPELYVYDNGVFNKIFPTDEVENVIVQVELTQAEYDAVLDGTSTEYTYDKNTVYYITDPDYSDAPKAYLQKKNILSADAILDAATLPSSPTQLATVNRNTFYRVVENITRFTSIHYYNLDAKYSFEPDATDPDDTVIVWTDDTGTKQYGAKFSELRDNDSDWQNNVVTYGIVETTKAAAVALTIVTYKDQGTDDKTKWVVAQASGFDDSATLPQDNIYMYSDDESKWICIYPSSVEFEDTDINFEDSTEWYPIMP